MSRPLAKPAAPQVASTLLGDIRQLIEHSHQQLVSTVNSTLTTLYWHIGQRIRAEVLKEERAAYGEQIVSAARRQLSWAHFRTLTPPARTTRPSCTLALVWAMIRWSPQGCDQPLDHPTGLSAPDLGQQSQKGHQRLKEWI